jgi:hypothetical protein
MNVKSTLTWLILFDVAVSFGPFTVAADTKTSEAKPAAAIGPSVKVIDQQLKLAEDASGTLIARVEVNGIGGVGKLDLPFAAWGDVEDFKLVEATVEGKVDLVTKGAAPHLTATLPAGTDTAVLRFSFKLPAPKSPVMNVKGQDTAKAVEGESRFKTIAHRFMNSTRFPVERYRLEVLLPEGYVVHTVPEALPKAKAKETTSRVRLIEKDGRQGAVLEMAGLRLGDATSMRIEYEPAKKSLAVLWFGLLLSVLYLMFFRDVLRPKSTTHEAEEHGKHSHKEHE